MKKRGEVKRRTGWDEDEDEDEGNANILPVSAFRQPYTSPNPPLPMIRCTEKSFIERSRFSSRSFHWQNRAYFSDSKNFSKISPDSDEQISFSYGYQSKEQRTKKEQIFIADDDEVWQKALWVNKGVKIEGISILDKKWKMQRFNPKTSYMVYWNVFHRYVYVQHVKNLKI